jgi:hypothetical protein
MWKKFPASQLNPLHAKRQYKDVLQDDPFLPWTSVMKCTMKVQKCLKVTSSIHGFPLWQKLSLCIFQHPKRWFSWTYCLRALFSYFFPWEMLCDAIPPSVVLFLDQSDGTSFPYLLWCHEESCCLQQHIIPATANETNFPVSQTFYHLMKQSTALSALTLSSVASL